MRRSTRRKRPAVQAVLAGALLIALGVIAGLLLRGTAPQGSAGPTGRDEEALATEPTIEDVVEKALPSVVRVTTEHTFRRRRGVTFTEELSGSGVYFDARGLVLTNQHVLNGAQSATIEYPPGVSVPVIRYAADAEYDLAVLDIGSAMADATPIPLGNSEQLRMGAPALIIGYPDTGDYSLGATLTTGVISGLNRQGILDDGEGATVGMIQTDAPINNGNSGGALLNAKGELVGIPTVKIQSTFGQFFEGLGFAIPVTECAPVIERLIDEVIGKRE